MAILVKDPLYAGKRAVLSELVKPSPSIKISSEGFSQVRLRPNPSIALTHPHTWFAPPP
jgi:hypothetical protein